jgi:Na+-translocating ferredoxin:NAD+ oxidoreductase RnfD subunit
MSFETLATGAEGMSTAAELSTLKASIPMSGAVSKAAHMGAVAPSIIGTIANTAFLLGGLFFVFKGVQMVVTGKNAFKKTV